ncbi:MAG: hypothetical protein FD118_3389 [Rhodocyclaceae bacterium]|nr:MAG: hypothetical protein FD118_3389 [Rhodocyclaceae bacterium]
MVWRPFWCRYCFDTPILIFEGEGCCRLWQLWKRHLPESKCREEINKEYDKRLKHDYLQMKVQGPLPVRSTTKQYTCLFSGPVVITVVVFPAPGTCPFN